MFEIFKVTLIAIFIGLATPSIAQHENDESHGKKETGIYEIITSGVYSYSPEHNEGVAGAEMHFTYWFNHKWGGGLAYTGKFEPSEIQNELALLGSWNPLRWLTLNVGPNIILPTKHDSYSLGIYSESEINIRPNEWFHFGPVIGVVYGHQLELNSGIHIGFEF